MLGQALDEPVEAVELLAHQDRRYSKVWFIDARVAGEPRHFVAKMWDSDEEFGEQVNPLRTALATCTEPDVCIPYVGSIREKRLLLMTRVDDPTLEDLCHVSLHPPFRIPFFGDARKNLIAACARAGRWLRGWHSRTAGQGDLRPALDAYLATRMDCVQLLQRRDREQIVVLAKNAPTGRTCVTHSAFVPQNLLWSPRRLTVIDFGVSEWKRMSPWWDCVSFEIGLHRALRFSPRHLGTWSPRLVTAAIRGFRSAYGRLEGDEHLKRACLALRHLVFYAEDTQNGYRRRAAWHGLQLRRAIAADRNLPDS